MARLTRNELVAKARGQIGKSYRFRACPSKAPDEFDCSSFTQWVYELEIPRFAYQQFEVCENLVPAREAMAADLVFVRCKYSRSSLCPVLSVGHVGIATGEGTVIHASHSARLVVEEPLDVFLSFASGVVSSGRPTRKLETSSVFRHVWHQEGICLGEW